MSVDERVVRRPEQHGIIRRLIEGGFEEATSSPQNDEYRRIIYEEQHPRVRGTVNPHRVEVTDVAAMTRQIKEVALGLGADKVGVCRIDPDHVYQGSEVGYKYGIVLGKRMEVEKIMAAPEAPAGIEATRIYMVLGEITIRLGQYIRDLGYEAMVHHPRGDRYCESEILFIPHAIAAGFGELGRHGSLINDEHGPLLRLGMVSTDLPLEIDQPRAFSVQAYCDVCTRCVHACPGGAIPLERCWWRGSYRYVVDTEKCLPYFARTDGCSICLKVCSYTRETVEETKRISDKIHAFAQSRGRV
jgi:epoxyqueuosine reductase